MVIARPWPFNMREFHQMWHFLGEKSTQRHLGFTRKHWLGVHMS
jgi:hypothetical protein